MALNLKGGPHRLAGNSGTNRASPSSSSLIATSTNHRHAATSAAAAATGASVGSLAGSSPSSASNKSYRNHQRRQSVARLLPDISKLRLLSWLVEASSELINCNIAIMDGVYAKLNRSQESLLFWNSQHSQHSQQQPTTALTSANHLSSFSNININRPPPPAPPLSQPVANKLVISQQQQKQKQKQGGKQPLLSAAKKTTSNQHPNQTTTTRNHHSLPLANYDASSMAAVSFIGSTPSSSLSRRSVKNSKHHQRQQSASKNLLVGCLPEATAAASSVSLLQQLTMMPTTSSAAQAASLSLNGGETTNDSIIKQQSDSIQGSDNDEDDDEEGDNSSAASSTTSSGIHGGGTSSLSSSASTSSSTSSSSSSASSSASTTSSSSLTYGEQITNQQQLLYQQQQQQQSRQFVVVSSAEQLSEKIRRTVMEHNYLQSLLVNIIRQHDKQRDQANQQRRRQLSVDQQSILAFHSATNGRFQQPNSSQHQRIDLADIADSLDDGCLCLCHSEHQHKQRAKAREEAQLSSSSNQSAGKLSGKPSGGGKSSTLPASVSIMPPAGVSLMQTCSTTYADNELEQQQQQKGLLPAGTSSSSNQPSRKARRLKKLRANNSAEITRKDLIDLMAHKLCENCFETHYWLHELYFSSTNELLFINNKAAAAATKETTSSSSILTLSSSSKSAAANSNYPTISDLNAIVTKRNATFIKLVQQEVRSTISKSIELIDLIRKEIKSPDSIKQKQLMRCFSTSIQLLTSVGNYVVPAQDISSFIPPEIGQNQTSLFSLPSSDFDHLLLYPSPSFISNNNNPSHQVQNSSLLSSAAVASNYHLASAPEIPIRRKFNNNRRENKSLSLADATKQQHLNANDADNKSSPIASRKKAEQLLSLKQQQHQLSDSADKAPGTSSTATIESSSGASSNNSSASSSIARGAVQQSSLTRAQTSSAILDGKTSHDMSYDSFAASLSRQQQTEDDLLCQSRPKFWHSSKFNFIKKLLHVKEQRLLRQQSKDRRIYNNKVQNKFRLVMMDLTHFNKSQQLLTTENGVNSLLTSMRNVLEFGLYLTLKLY